MKNVIILILLFSGFVSCQEKREKDSNEIVLAEFIVEKDGIYFSGDCEIHSENKFSGSSEYYHENGKIKGTYTIKNGLPDGHWEQFNSDGTKKLDLYFKNGSLLKKIKHKQ
nr:hypothetical protein [uncultured Flavobacterium sp.]